LSDYPREPGTYILELELCSSQTITVGRLGSRLFVAGWYYYVGSALHGLRARLQRHERVGKPRHWHIDALRERAELVSVYFTVSSDRLECSTAAALVSIVGMSTPIRGFGSSDCTCSTHLFASRDHEVLEVGPDWSRVALISGDESGRRLLDEGQRTER
jgi:Uri superfamily endonuclease